MNFIQSRTHDYRIYIPWQRIPAFVEQDTVSKGCTYVLLHWVNVSSKPEQLTFMSVMVKGLKPEKSPLERAPVNTHNKN